MVWPNILKANIRIHSKGNIYIWVFGLLFPHSTENALIHFLLLTYHVNRSK